MNLKLARKALGIVTFAITIIGLPSVSWADGAQCGDDGQAPCPVERVEISGCGASCVSTGFGGGWGLGGGTTGGTGGGGTAYASPNKPSGEAPLQFIQRIVKTFKSLCKKGAETCPQWGARMMANENVGVLDGTGGLTASGSAGFCTAVGLAFGVNALTTCTLGVQEETNLQECADVPACE